MSNEVHKYCREIDCQLNSKKSTPKSYRDTKTKISILLKLPYNAFLDKIHSEVIWSNIDNIPWDQFHKCTLFFFQDEFHVTRGTNTSGIYKEIQCRRHC